MKNALLLLKEFEKLGYLAYIVGGSVRDYLLKSESFDIDIATSATPDEVMKHFKSSPIGIKYGTVLVFFNDEEFEVTTFRKDLEYFDNRHPYGVLFSKTIKEDVARRDFTINGMYLDNEFNVVDLVGGKDDLEKRLIRSIGNPDERFREDALRMLRAFYLVSKLDFEIEEETLKSIIRNKELIKNVSAERIYREISKIINYDNSLKALDLMVQTGIYLYLPGLHQGIKYIVDNHILLSGEYFFAMCFYKNSKVDKFWKLSNKEKLTYQKVIEFLNHKGEIDNNLLYQYDYEDIIIVAKLNNYLNVFDINEYDMIKMYHKLPIKRDSDLDISNKKIINIIGIEPGPWLSDLKKEITNMILSGKLYNKEEDIKEFILKRKDKYEK